MVDDLLEVSQAVCEQGQSTSERLVQIFGALRQSLKSSLVTVLTRDGARALH